MRKRGVIEAAVMACVASHALAHAIVVDSTPAPYAHLPAGTLHIALRYNSRIDAGRSKLTMRHGGDVQRLSPSTTEPPDILAARTDVTAGEYEIAWQVLATDGHVTRGRVPFTVDPPKAVAAK